MTAWPTDTHKTINDIMKHILRLVNYCKNTITSTQPTLLPWRFGLYQRPSSEEVCSIPLPVLATIVLRRGKKSVARVALSKIVEAGQFITWLSWESSVIPRHKVWLAAAARVPCSNAANIGECKTWTQGEFCSWQNSVRGQQPAFCFCIALRR